MFAESARRFLDEWLKNTLKVKSNEIDENTDLNVFEGKGIYFLWCKETDLHGNFLVPVYVGITGGKFSDRFVNHKQIRRILDGNCPTAKKEKKVTVMTNAMLLPAAKFLESTMMFAFNFALNKHENNERRDHLVQATVTSHEGRHHFSTVLGNLIGKLTKLQQNG